MKLKALPGCELDVLRSLFENQSAYDAGHALPHKILGIGTGGGMCCIRTAATFDALEEAGLTHAFTNLITVSGAGGPAGGYLSGLAYRTHTFFEYLAVAQFIIWSPWYQAMMNLRMYEKALNGELMPFGFVQEKIVQHPTGWFVTAATESGAKRILNAKTVRPNAARAVCASSAFPYTCAPVQVDNEGIHEAMVDGVGGGNPLPIEDGLALLGPLAQGERPKILVMQSRTHPKHRRYESALWPWYVLMMYYPWMHPLLRVNLASTESCFASEAERLNVMREIDWCRIAPTPEDVPLEPYTISQSLLRKGRDQTKIFMRKVLKDAKPVRHI